MSVNKSQFGTPISATATGTTTTTASVTGVAGVTFYVTTISGSSDLSGATIQVKDGSTVIWQDRVSNTTGYIAFIEPPLTCTQGNTVSVVVTGTSASNANLSGFSITP